MPQGVALVPVVGVPGEGSCIGQGWSFCRSRNSGAAVLGTPVDDWQTAVVPDTKAGPANDSEPAVGSQTADPAT